ncbi:MAG: protein kinase [Deltaproteobacteria bacterium]|nr:protein kinase [Deltaproteobacteria bacterium]
MREPIPFGKYLLLERISVGGMAEVFKAKSFGVEGFEKNIAIKRILPSMAEDSEFIQMFIDEAKIAGQLSHANICQIFELGKIDDSHFIAMEFVWGKDLLQIQQRLRKVGQSISPQMAAFIAAKTCEGLDYAHRKKDAQGRPLFIIHRDVSPQNILVSYEGEVKLIDFGIAKATSRSSKTQAGVLKGKFGYMSPEQVRGLPLDRRSDLFAVGTMLHELLTGQRLFQGENDFSTLEKIRNVDIHPPRFFNPEVPERLERIILKALSRDVEDRYQWASDLQEDLMSFLKSTVPIYSAKHLSQWMKEAFRDELAREQQLSDQFRRLEQGQGASWSGDTEEIPELSDMVEVPEGSTVSEGPKPFAPRQAEPEVGEDLGDSTFVDFETVPRLGAQRRNVTGGAHSFGEEGPTELFGEVQPVAPVPLSPRIEPAAVVSPAPVIVSDALTRPNPTPRAAPVVSGAVPLAVRATLTEETVPLRRGSVPPLAMGTAGESAKAAPTQLQARLAQSGSLPAAAKETRNKTAALPRFSPATSRARRAPLWQDIGIGVGVAAVVMALVAGVYSWISRKQAPRVVANDGTLVVAVADTHPAEVLVNGILKGKIDHGDPVKIEGMPPGSYQVVVRRAGAADCQSSVELGAGGTEVVSCRFFTSPPSATLHLEVATEGAIVLLDNQEISADAAREPMVLVPSVPHEIVVKRDGYVSSSLTLSLRPGEVAARRVELQPLSGVGGARPSVAPGSSRPRTVPLSQAQEFGYLIANTTPWARVLIDNRDTGRTTPIAPRTRLPLLPGKHTVTFVVGEKKFSYPITIEVGTDYRLIEQLPIETPGGPTLTPP